MVSTSSTDGAGSAGGPFAYAPAPESRSVVDIKSSYGLFINGEFVDGSGKAFKTISPSTEEVLAEVEGAFFGPFRVSAMLDSNGCNTTAATTVARLARELDLKDRRVVIVGAGAVGLRAAALLANEGCEVTVSGIPASRFGDKPYRRARGLDVAEKRGMKTVEPEDDEA